MTIVCMPAVYGQGACISAYYELAFNTVGTKWRTGVYELNFDDSVARFQLVQETGGSGPQYITEGTTTFRYEPGPIDIDSNLIISTLADSTFLWKATPRNEAIVIRDTLKMLPWTITDSIKYCVDSMICRKATVTAYGRDYTAWFLPSVNTRFGVYKLHGLPGLMAELNSMDGLINVALLRAPSRATCSERTYLRGEPGTMKDVERALIR